MLITMKEILSKSVRNKVSVRREEQGMVQLLEQSMKHIFLDHSSFPIIIIAFVKMLNKSFNAIYYYKNVTR